jgi:hypothetical protein
MSNGESIKALTRHMVERVKNAKTAAAICGVSEMSISRWGNDDENQFIPVDHLIDLDAAAGDLFLKEWARQRGYEITPRSRIAPKPSVLASRARSERSPRRLANLASRFWRRLPITHLRPAEKRRIRDRIAPVKDGIAQLERAIA